MEKQFIVVDEAQAEYVVENPPAFIEGNWFQMFKKFVLRQASISVAARAIFLVLIRYVNNSIKSSTGQAVSWPSFSLITRATGIRSHNTITRGIQELMDLGYIQDRYFDFPPRTDLQEINVQKVWIYTLGEIDDNAEFARRAKQTKLLRAITKRSLNQKFQ